MIAQKHANGDQTWTERETYFLAKGSTYTRPNMHVGTLGWDKPWWCPLGLGLGLGSLVRSSQFSDKLGHHSDYPKNLYACTLLLDIIRETIMSMCKFLDVIFIPNVILENLATTPVSFGALANGFVSRN